MPFGEISAFHLPIAGNAGSNQWGTGDVRKLLSAAEASADTTSITDHGTGGSVTRTVDPYTTKATDDTQANFGWAVTPDDMNAVAGRYVLDASGNNRHGLVNGSPSLIAGVTNFGSRPLFTGAAGGGLSLSALAKPAGDWTVEIRIRRDRQGVAEYLLNWSAVIGGTYYGMNLFLATNNKLALQYYENGVLTGLTATAGTVANGEHQIAAEYFGGVMYLLLDGVVAGSFTPSAYTAQTFDFYAACATSAISNNFQGAVDEVRVSNVSRYSGANYTPATTPFISDASTMLLWHCDAISAKRVIAAGNHTINGRMRDNSSTGTTATLLMYVYRVAAGSGRARTLLGSNSASVTLPALAAIADGVVSVNLAEIILEPDETIQYAFEITASGMAVSGRSITFLTGLSTTSVRVTIPAELQLLASAPAAATVAADMTGSGAMVLGTVADMSALVATTLDASSIWGGDLAAAAAASLDGVGSSIAGGDMNAAIDGSLSADGAMVSGGVLESGEAGGANTYARSRVVNR